LVGYIHPDHFLGGRMKLDEDAARVALEAIADKVGIEGDDKAVKAADAALRVATAMMSTELYKGLARRGEDPREYALMAFGGAGPTHGNLLAQEARLDGIIVPPAPATFCAMGAILADVKRDYVRSRHLRFTDGKAALADLARIFREIEQEASDWIAKEGDLLGEPEFAATLDMRYAGQAYDLGVAIPDELRINPEAEGILELFHREHERIYSFRDLESGVEVTTQRIRVIGRIPPVTLPNVEAGARAKAGEKRRIFNQGKYADVPVYLRREMGRGQKLKGPAILEQRDSTIWVLPDWTAEIDRIGNILITAPNGKK
jgi:N-methylhydantoinase A